MANLPHIVVRSGRQCPCGDTPKQILVADNDIVFFHDINIYRERAMGIEAIREQANAEETASITIRLPAKDVKLLQQLARLTGSTKERLANKFILESAEDLADTLIAKDEIEAIRTGKSKLRTWDEMGLDF